MRESAFHEHVRTRSGTNAPGVVVGPGDDCAVLDTGGPELQLITTDQLIAGRHYDPVTTPVELIARKALARSVSDIAAMCGRPVASVCTASFAGDAKMSGDLFDAMAALGEEWGAPLVGGDFASGNATQFTTTVLGLAPRGNPGPILRSGARVGDAVWVTGRIGDSYESGHHLRFTPRFAEGLELRERLGAKLHAAIDVSDGLGRDAGRIARMSGVGIVIEAERVPLRDASRGAERSIADGEDYELLFVTAGEVDLPATLGKGTVVTRIGTVVEGGGAVLRFADGRAIDVTEAGWDHGD